MKSITIVGCKTCRRAIVWEERTILARLRGVCIHCGHPLDLKQLSSHRNPIPVLSTANSGASYYFARLHGEAMLQTDYVVKTQEVPFDRLTRVFVSHATTPTWQAKGEDVWPPQTYSAFALVHDGMTHDVVAGSLDDLQSEGAETEWLGFVRCCHCTTVLLHANRLQGPETPDGMREVLEYDRFLSMGFRLLLRDGHSIERIAVVLTAVDMLGSQPQESCAKAYDLFCQRFPTLRQVIANSKLPACVIPTSSIGFVATGESAKDLRFPPSARPFNIMAPIDFLIGRKTPPLSQPLAVSGSAVSCFVSYTRSDAAHAVRLASDLQKYGVQTWRDVDDIPPGASWDQEIEKAIVSCSHVLLLVTPRSLESQNVKDEIGYARERGKPIIPVVFQDAQLPLRVHRAQAIDFTSDYADGLSRLLSTLTGGRHNNVEIGQKQPQQP